MKIPLTEQPGDGFVEGQREAYRLKAAWLWLRRLIARVFSESDQLRPGVFCIQPEAQKCQEELLLVMPAKLKPTKLVIVGDWGDSFPEVQLVQLKMQ